ncbi:MAG: hypothetical protein HYR63_23480 [Proteobacteria bacterium]|nr:hypothetical protein [Pseudomonadota bacterium]
MFAEIDWQKLAADTVMLMAEAQMVVALRLGKLAGGGAAAEAECRRMVDEKWSAAVASHWDWLRLLAAGRGHDAMGRSISSYRRKVRANRRRLLRA